jgi:predicted Zn-dependent protease
MPPQFSKMRSKRIQKASRSLTSCSKKQAANAGDDPAVLKDVADYFAASQQIQEAIPFYLRVLELQPNDSNAREKLASGFVLTNQRDKAIEMLQEIIKQHPDRYQPYDLLGQLLDEGARDLARARQTDAAKAEFAKAAVNYEQSLIDQPRSRKHLFAFSRIINRSFERQRARRQASDRSSPTFSRCSRIYLLFGSSAKGGKSVPSRPLPRSKKL